MIVRRKRALEMSCHPKFEIFPTSLKTSQAISKYDFDPAASAVTISGQDDEIPSLSA